MVKYWSPTGYGLQVSLNMIKQVCVCWLLLSFFSDFLLVFSQMLSYTIYIIATRKHLSREGKKNQRFQREAYNDARNHFLPKFSAAAPSSSSSSSSSTSGTPIRIPSSEMSYSSSICSSNN